MRVCGGAVFQRQGYETFRRRRSNMRERRSGKEDLDEVRPVQVMSEDTVADCRGK